MKVPRGLDRFSMPAIIFCGIWNISLMDGASGSLRNPDERFQFHFSGLTFLGIKGCESHSPTFDSGVRNLVDLELQFQRAPVHTLYGPRLVVVRYRLDQGLPDFSGGLEAREVSMGLVTGSGCVGGPPRGPSPRRRIISGIFLPCSSTMTRNTTTSQ